LSKNQEEMINKFTIDFAGCIVESLQKIIQ